MRKFWTIFLDYLATHIWSPMLWRSDFRLQNYSQFSFCPFGLKIFTPPKWKFSGFDHAEMEGNVNVIRQEHI